MKKLQNKMKVNLYEKSFNKCVFLKEVSKKLKLNTEIIQKDIFSVKNLRTGTVMSRAFRPLPVILNLINNNEMPECNKSNNSWNFSMQRRAHPSPFAFFISSIPYLLIFMSINFCF